MESQESTSDNTNINFLNNEEIIEKAKTLIKQNNIENKEIIKCAQELSMIPILEDEICPNALFSVESFEIVSNENSNPIFIRNLLNIISIINFVWIASKNKIDSFHEILLTIGIMFSYTFRNEKNDKEGIDYVLLSTIPTSIYESIAKYGKKSFKNPSKFNFDESFFSTDKNEIQIGYVYEQNSIANLISELKDKGLKICPKIMYYLSYEFSKNLFNKKIFNNPGNFNELNHVNNGFYGFNEIDFSFILSDDHKFFENNLLNRVKERGKDHIEYTSYKSDNPNEITFRKNSNIFIEYKANISADKIEETLKNLKKLSIRFSLCYKNTAFQDLEKKFSTNDLAYNLFYNNKRDKILNLKTLDNEAEIYFNSGFVEISSIVSLQNQIREVNLTIDKIKENNNYLKNKVEDMENAHKEYVEESNKKINDMENAHKIYEEESNKKINDMENANKEYVEESNKKINDMENAHKIYEEETNKKINDLNKTITNLTKQLEKSNNENKLNFSIIDLKNIKHDKNTIKKILEKAKKDKNISIFNIFKFNYDKYKKCLDLFLKIYEEEKIISYSKNLIGKKLIEQEQKDYAELIDILNNKIEQNLIASKYYLAFRNVLLGNKYNKGDKIKDFDLFSGEENISKTLKEIIECIFFIEEYGEFETIFLEVVLYLAYNIAQSEKTYENLFYIKLNEDPEKYIIFIIESFNEDNFKLD